MSESDIESIKSERHDPWEETKNHLDALCSVDLIKTVTNLKKELQRFTIENMVFENFLNTHEPTLISGMGKTMTILSEVRGNFLSATSIRSSSTADVHSVISGVTSSIAGRRMVTKGKGPRINFSQKTDLIMREIDDGQKQLDTFQDSTHRQMNRLRAEIEENSIRDAEVKETAECFEQQIVIEAVEELTQKIPAEKFVRYMQEWLKFAQGMLEKLRLRTNNLCTQERKLKQLLIQKEDLGECVHEVDFEKLDIENKNFLLTIDKKNQNLLDLKQINGKASLMLTTHKNFLQKQDEYMNKLLTEMTAVEQQITSLQSQYELTEVELEREHQKYDKMKKVVKNYQVPDVMEYILKKSEMDEYRKQLKVWKRKVNIQSIVMHTYIKIMCHLTNSSRPKSKWLTEKPLMWHDDRLLEDDVPRTGSSILPRYKSLLSSRSSMLDSKLRSTLSRQKK